MFILFCKKTKGYNYLIFHSLVILMSGKKKIVYLIYSTNIGLGGHYYSLLALSNSLRFDNDISIINIGYLFSKALENQQFKTYFIKHRNLITTCILLKRLIEKLKPDIIHSFDPPSLALLKLIMRKKKLKHIHTHCGGPNPKFFPTIKNLILFSQENYQFFKKNKCYHDSNIYLIPNRVLPIKTDSKRINMLLNEANFEFPIFLRICRINQYYIQSLIQSIKLVEKLRNRGIKANLIIIGVPLARDVLKFIKKYENNYIKIFIQENFTINANELIDIADFVIGTGRSLMEGAYFSKVILVPQKDKFVPLLVDNETFKTSFDVNFSERTRYNKYNEEINFNKIVQCIEDEIEYKKLARFIKSKSEIYFEISNKIKLYKKIYKKIESDYINHKRFGLLREIHKIMLYLYYSELFFVKLNKIIRWAKT